MSMFKKTYRFIPTQSINCNTAARTTIRTVPTGDAPKAGDIEFTTRLVKSGFSKDNDVGLQILEVCDKLRSIGPDRTYVDGR